MLNSFHLKSALADRRSSEKHPLAKFKKIIHLYDEILPELHVSVTSLQ